MATSTTSSWLMATMLCLAAATIVAGDMSGATDALENVEFMEFASFAGAVEGQRSLLQTGAATPTYSPKSPSPSPAPRPCTFGDKPNSNTYSVQMSGVGNWGYGRKLMQIATRAVYTSAKYNFPTLAITVSAGLVQRPRPNRRSVNVWTYTVVVPVPRCTGKKEGLRNALRNALKTSTRGSTVLRVNSIA